MIQPSQGKGSNAPVAGKLPWRHRVWQDILHGLGLSFLPFSAQAMARTALPGQEGEESELYASHSQCC